MEAGDFKQSYRLFCGSIPPADGARCMHCVANCALQRRLWCDQVPHVLCDVRGGGIINGLFYVHVLVLFPLLCPLLALHVLAFVAGMDIGIWAKFQCP